MHYYYASSPLLLWTTFLSPFLFFLQSRGWSGSFSILFFFQKKHDGMHLRSLINRARATTMKCKTIQVLWHGKVRRLHTHATHRRRQRLKHDLYNSLLLSSYKKNSPSPFPTSHRQQDPVLSVDFNPASGLLASCGTDKEVKVRARATRKRARTPSTLVCLLLTCTHTRDAHSISNHHFHTFEICGHHQHQKKQPQHKLPDSLTPSLSLSLSRSIRVLSCGR
jgi:WD40 repeat protein